MYIFTRGQQSLFLQFFLLFRLNRNKLEHFVQNITKYFSKGVFFKSIQTFKRTGIFFKEKDKVRRIFVVI